MTVDAALRFLTFHVDEHLYALPAGEVREIIRLPSVVRVPRAPAALLGFANHRGSIIPLASLRGLLGGPASTGVSSTSRAIVLDRGTLVAIAVDRVDALVEARGDSLQTRTGELAERAGERLKGAFQLDARVAKVLDIDALLESAFTRREKPQRQNRIRAAPSHGEAAKTEDAEILVTFDVAEREYALGVEEVREIVSAPTSLVGLSRDEATVVGMIALRDRVLPLFSLRGLLGFARPPERNAREKVIVVSIGGALVGLIADRVREIVSAERGRIDPLPPLLAARIGGEAKVKAIYRGEAGRRLISILAPEKLFREDVMQRLGSTQDAAPRATLEADQRSGSRVSFLVFRLGSEEFALPIEAIDEVRRVPDQIARIPKSPKFLEGVVNVRGDILPVLDQRRRFEMPDSRDRKNRRLIVVRTDGGRAGVIVDSVSEVLSRSAETVEEAPGVAYEIARLVRGVINLESEDRIVLVLDPSELLTRTERDSLGSLAPSSQPELS